MSCGKFLMVDISRNFGGKNAHNNIEKCKVISLTKKENNKYQNMGSSNNFTMFRRNQVILNTEDDTVPKKEHAGFTAGRSKHGSYQRYLASKTAKAGYCKPTDAVITKYENDSHLSRKNLIGYMGFLRNYRCHSGLSKQISLHAETHLNTSINKLKLNYTDDRLNNIVHKTYEIFDSLITTYSSDYSISVMVSSELPEGVLADATTSLKRIRFNSTILDSDGTTMSKLNDVSVLYNAIVLIHEVLHIIGLVAIDGNNIQGDLIGVGTGVNQMATLRYTGTHGVAGYKQVLTSNQNDINTQLSISIINSAHIEKITSVPLEDDFGTGTNRHHWEEGANGNGSEIRVFSDGTEVVRYPILSNEIMTGFITNVSENKGEYITPITVGALKDTGHIINDASPWIVTTGSNMEWV